MPLTCAPCQSLRIRATVVAVGFFCVAAQLASAQTSPPGSANQGALTFTGGLDVPSVYVYRGIVQEGDPKLTLAPYGDVGIRLRSGEGLFGSMRVNIGVWNSLNTGTSGSGGPVKALHYAEQFYATLTFGPVKGVTVTPGYLANSSPNGSYQTIQEMNLKIAASGRFAPYGLVAFELGRKGQLDGGSKKGTYLELGVGPSLGLPFWHARLSVPLKAGFSLQNYYELFGRDLTYKDHAFGFAGVGGHISVPLSSLPARFGSWSVHGGADVLSLGDTTKAFNRGKKTKVVGLAGISVTY